MKKIEKKNLNGKMHFFANWGLQELIKSSMCSMEKNLEKKFQSVP